MKYFLLHFILTFATLTQAQQKFAQLDYLLPQANTYRLASGAPGHEYWQQQADYNIKVEIDENTKILTGKETITYHNNAPENLSFLWLQLDQNYFSKESASHQYNQNNIEEKMSPSSLLNLEPEFDGGHKITAVKDANGKNLPFTINQTMMRIDLPKPLPKGEKVIFQVEWWYNITNKQIQRGRSGYENFDDGNAIFCIAQFFPRMCKYYDTYGWQNKQFMGRGEFTLEFGNYLVEITVPQGHLVAATGTLTNETEVLDVAQKQRLHQARKEFTQPVTISTLEEANQRMAVLPVNEKKTWKFSAENVRDFAFASSRRFIWDAMNTELPNGKTAMAMSMWPKEGDCLWSKYSTKVIAHTLKWFSHYSVDYSYPVAWSIDGEMGMEYPMIAFNAGRCEADNTYSERAKYGHIGVIIHEIGHNFFPMIINSDERQWSWMDEGLTTFVQYLTEQHWERDYPAGRGPAYKIVDYMKSDPSTLSPIMTNSESAKQFGNNAYAKPATALNILRETIMGRELFDKAFKEYCNRWAFKTPTPADFFRTMEDVSAVDLDWFWRAWFFTTQPVDLSLNIVNHYQVDPKDPDKKYELAKENKQKAPKYISDIINQKAIEKTYSEIDTTLIDFYSRLDKSKPDQEKYKEYQQYLASMNESEKTTVNSEKHYYEISFENKGGLPMPLILDFVYEDDSIETKRIPAEIWRYDDSIVTKVFVTDKPIKQIILDPYLETADIDRSNNQYPPQEEIQRFDVFKQRQQRSENPMQRAAKAREIKP
ncbi:MAG: M1 family metallopeptidase [Saprospiraceae bacterium]|nr:M1 family metallopeptidase [Saprospiraceae bacterium]